jgi:tRNA-binding protein
MAREIKSIVKKEETFDLLEIRVGKIIDIKEEPSAAKKSYKLTVDFGKFGIKTSVGQFTQHPINELKNQLVLGILNFESRKMGDIESEVLILGVQFPKADSGEATIITSKAKAKIGGKLF